MTSDMHGLDAYKLGIMGTVVNESAMDSRGHFI